jgi:NADPH-dependent curcumin reductase CurA
MSETCREILLASRPVGVPVEDNFELVERRLPEPGQDEVLVRTIYQSLDPYMRRRMDDVKSYASCVGIGEVMPAGTVGQVIASRSNWFSEGDFVAGLGGWRSHFVAATGAVQRIDPDSAPISTALGVLGMPGQTAYAGLLEFGKPQQGETVFVSAASGAVGSVVGQIAKIRGARAVGVAGSDEKCAYVVDELGFDACINHRSANLRPALREACPQGIDVNFENVGGRVFEAAMDQLNLGGRVVLSGFISHYNAVDPATPMPDGMTVPSLLTIVLGKQALIHGLQVRDFTHLHDQFLADVSTWIQRGKLKYREDIVEGLENAPRAFIGLLEGRNFGKLLVQVSDDPTRGVLRKKGLRIGRITRRLRHRD